MIFLEKKMVRSSFFILFVQLISSYLIFSASPRNTEIRIQSSYTNSLSDDGLKSENDQIKQLNNKLVIDLAKNDVLELVKLVSSIYVTLDLEGKIIGYKPFVINMPNYWNSQVTKQILMKNNLFSLSYEDDQVVSFRLSSLI